MKNKNLKSLMSAKVAIINEDKGIIVLNQRELDYALGGTEEAGGPDCPNLKTCGTLSECNTKCTVDGIKVGF